MPRSGSPWPGRRTSWGCGPGPAGRAPSSGWRVLTDLRTAASRTCSSWSATGSRACPTSWRTSWPLTTCQTCIIHLIRNTFHLASKRDWDALKRAVRPIYTAVNAAAARAGARRAGRRMGAALRRDHPAVGQRLGAVHPVPGLRHRDPQGPVQHERDRVAERPLPAGGQGPRPLPDRAGRAKVPLPGHPVPGPDRDRPHHDGRCGGNPP